MIQVYILGSVKSAVTTASGVLSGLRVVLVGPLPPPAGGMANQAEQLREFLALEAASCVVVRTNAPYWPVWVARLRGIRALFRLIPYLVRLNRACRSADLVQVMANSGWSWHLCAAPAILIARSHRRPVVVNYRGGYAREFFRRSWFWVDKTLRRAQQIIVPSSFLQEVFEERQVEAWIVPNLLDDRVFSFQPRYRRSDHPRLVVARNLEPIYDLGTAIRMFALVKRAFPTAGLAIAGSGPELDNLRTLCERTGLADSVTFTGNLRPEQVAELYHSADISVNPSLVDNAPNSVIESLACGVPVVTTNVGGIPRLVTPEYDAMLVDPKRPDQMAHAVIRVLSDTDLRRRLIDNGQSTARQCTWPQVKDRLTKAYLSAVEKNMR